MENEVLYRIRPVDKKSIEAFYDVYKELPDGSTKGFTITELYRWGQGFVDSEDDIPFIETKRCVVDPALGDGCELDDLISVDFDYDDDFTDEEKQEIEDAWYDGGLGWLVDGEHDWLIDYESITIYGPYKVDKITYSDYNIISEEEVELKPMPPRKPLDPNSAWPF